VARLTGPLAGRIAATAGTPVGWVLASAVTAGAALLLLVYVLPVLLAVVEAVFGAIPLLSLLTEPVIGATTQHYLAVWIDNEFYRNFLNSLLVTAGTVTISLTVGTLAGYALARSGSNLAFWLLIAALVFRALPHSCW
jgi:ABC-type sugar transport system, permease component